MSHFIEFYTFVVKIGEDGEKKGFRKGYSIERDVACALVGSQLYIYG